MKNNKIKVEKNREETENRLLEAVGELIDEIGFEKIGVNAVAEKAGVSKMLIYRYFGSIEKLVEHYILKKDFWINISKENFEITDVKSFIKELFNKQIQSNRQDSLLKRLHRWELSSNNIIVEELRKKREKNGKLIIELISKLTQQPIEEIAPLATIISSSISYLTMLEDVCHVYNNINIQSNEGWKHLSDGINTLIDNWFNTFSK